MKNNIPEKDFIQHLKNILNYRKSGVPFISI